MSEEVRMTSSTGGQKGQKLARFDLIPPDALWVLAELYGQGAKKYADRNWELGYEYGLSLAALQRHLKLWEMGEKDDIETGMPHLASVIFHAMALLHFELNPDKYGNFDDIHTSQQPRSKKPTQASLTELLEGVKQEHIKKAQADVDRWRAGFKPGPGQTTVYDYADTMYIGGEK